MTSTELNIGLSSRSRPSSRVLKPPGGGHSNIFAEPEVTANPPRPKYNQQNSSNLNCVMNTMDPNEAAKKTREEIEKAKQTAEVEKQRTEAEIGTQSANNVDKGQNNEQNSTQERVRVPPGGFSSGLW